MLEKSSNFYDGKYCEDISIHIGIVVMMHPMT